MHIGYGSTKNAKQAWSEINRHFKGVSDQNAVATTTATVKVHGMGAGIVLDGKSQQYQTHEVSIITVPNERMGCTPEDMPNMKEYYGFAHWALSYSSVWDEIYTLLHTDEYPIVRVIGEWTGYDVQTNGSMAWAPNKHFIVFGVECLQVNEDFDPKKNQGTGNEPYNKIQRAFPYDLFTTATYERIADERKLYTIESFGTIEGMITPGYLKEATWGDFKDQVEGLMLRVEENCPVGALLNPGGTLHGEGLVWSVWLPEVSYSMVFPGKAPIEGIRPARMFKFKHRGEKHKRRQGHTAIGAGSKALNDWCVESGALHNDRLEQIWEKLVRLRYGDEAVTPSPRDCGIYHNLVMQDIWKECMCYEKDFTDEGTWSFDYLNAILRKPIYNYFRPRYDEAYPSEYELAKQK